MTNRTFHDAILAQPENLENAARAFDEAVSEQELPGGPEATFVFSGIGASAHALIPAVLALRAAGRRAFAVSSAELRQAGAAGLGDVYVLVSQSGASVETVEALDVLDDRPVIAVSAQGESPLARSADVWLPLGPRPDTPVATLSYTATLQALGLLCERLLGRDANGAGWQALPSLAAQVLDRSAAAVEALAPAFADIGALDAAGGGPSAASAGEAALLGREALRLPSTGMETREYLHGPLEAVSERFGALVFGGEREHALASALRSYGATVWLVSATAARDGVPGVQLPGASPLATPLLEILPVQLLVHAVAGIRGLTIGALARHQEDTKVPR